MALNLPAIGDIGPGWATDLNAALTELDSALGGVDFSNVVVEPGEALADAPRLLLAPGTHNLAANLTLTGRITAVPGAVIRPASGVTLTIAGAVEAGPWRIFDLSAGGKVQFTAAARVEPYVDWWGAVRGQDCTQAFRDAVASLSWLSSTDALARVLRVLDGDYIINGEISIKLPLIIEGQSSYGTRLVVGSSFPADGKMLRFERGTSLLAEESHVPGFGLRHICLDGKARTVVAHALYLDFADRITFDDVWIRWFRGSAIIGYRSVREAVFHDIKTWYCGSSTAPTLDFFDNGTGTDGHNLLRFNACNFALCPSDFLRFGSASTASVARNLFFVGTVFHGLNEWIDTYPDNYHPGDIDIVDAGRTKQRLLFQNGRNVFFDSCRIIGFGRGHPLFHLVQDPTVGASTNNSVRVSGSALYRGGYLARTVTAVDATADTLTIDAVGLSTGHHLETGSKVLLLSGGTPPAPLANNTNYFVIRVSATAVKLATTRADAVAGTAINITDAGTGAITLTQQDSGVSAVSAAADTITSTTHRFSTGARVRFTSDGGNVPAGLVAGTDYFLIRVDANTLKVASSRLNAEAGTAIDITDAGTGQLSFAPQDFVAWVETGTFDLGDECSFDISPNRALVRQEANTTLLLGAANVYTIATPVERSDGGFHTLSYPGNMQVRNNQGFFGQTVAGSSVGLAKVSAGDVVQLGNFANLSGIGVQVLGQTAADLYVNNVLRVRTTSAGVAFNGVVTPPTRTGWTAPTGTSTKTAFDTATVTVAQLAERVKALLDFLIARGDISS